MNKDVKNQDSNNQNEKKNTMKKRKHTVFKRKIKYMLMYITTFILILSLGVALSTTVFFKIDKIEVCGESRYDKEDIKSSCGINLGTNLILCNTSNEASKIESKFPYLEGTVVKRVLPNKIQIIVNDVNPYGAIENNGQYVLVNKDGKVIDICTELNQNAPIIKGAKVLSSEVGNKVELENQSLYDMIFEISGKAIENNIKPITEVDVSNGVNLSLTYDNRIKIVIGVPENVDYKIRTAASILSDKIAKEEKGELDVSLAAQDNRSYFIPDYLLDNINI